MCRDILWRLLVVLGFKEERGEGGRWDIDGM
jgi:hypothetical protein